MSLSTNLTGRFTREPDTDEQIDNLAGLPPVRLVALLSKGEFPNGWRVKEETLVYALRRLHEAGDGRLAADVARLLLQRVKTRLARALSVWGFDMAPDKDEAIDEIVTDFYRHLFDLGPGDEFWEVRFWICFDRMILRLMRDRRRPCVLGLPPDDDEFGVPDNTPSRLSWEDHPETSALIGDALAVLPDDIRTAFLLKHWCGYTEEGTSGAMPSIADVLGVTGRTVRNYMRRAEAHLAAWRDDDDPGTERNSQRISALGERRVAVAARGKGAASDD